MVDVPSNLISTLTDELVNVFIAVDFDFVNASDVADPLRIWSGYGSIDIDNNTYTGVGDLLKVSAMSEGHLQAAGAMVSLSGVPTAMLNKALAYPYHGRDAVIYMGFTTDSGTLINTVELYRGQVDQMVIAEEPDSAVIQVTIENIFLEFDKTSNLRANSSNHKSSKSAHSGDLGFDHLESLQTKVTLWGRNAG